MSPRPEIESRLVSSSIPEYVPPVANAFALPRASSFLFQDEVAMDIRSVACGRTSAAEAGSAIVDPTITPRFDGIDEAKAG